MPHKCVASLSNKNRKNKWMHYSERKTRMMKRQELQLLSKNKKTGQKKGREKMLCTGDANAGEKQMP
jgi:hypothetical protein